MIFEMRFQILALAASLAVSTLAGYAVSETPTASLASPDRFAAASDSSQWAATIFTEFGNEMAWQDEARINRCAASTEAAHHGNGLLEALIHQVSQDSPNRGAGAPGKTACSAP
jgi:hypothetical protein